MKELTYKLTYHGNYQATVYDGEVEIDIRKDDGGWSGCGHPGEILLTRADLESLLRLMDEQ